MTPFTISTSADVEDLMSYVSECQYTTAKIKMRGDGADIQFSDHESFNLVTKSLTYEEKQKLFQWLKCFNKKPAASPLSDEEAERTLIFGKDTTTHVVSIESTDGSIEVFTEKNGVVSSEIRPNKYWLLAPRKYTGQWEQLDGNLYYKYIKWYDTKQALYEDKNRYRAYDVYSIADGKESAMLTTGITYYKGMKVDDVSRLHFDLETTGLIESKQHRILLISTTFVKLGVTYKKLFSVDEYASDGEMLVSFCEYVRECNPSVISGFNIFGFDFPYLKLCADKEDVKLELGRNGSTLRFDKRSSKFRKDGSQDYEYKRCHIYGREIVDMMHVAYHFDFARKYERYALKSIIEQEGLEKEGRTFYDASKIRHNWDIPEERIKIKAYCIDDADDSESLYKLMINSYFYFSRSIPKSFQSLNYSATGSQLNALLLRSYLQNGHSVPKATDVEAFKGAISVGNPGIYSNCWKVDLNALYPSIIIQFQIYDQQKDPKANFLKMVDFFRKERLANKKLGIETGDRYYKDLEQSQKIGINSSYGLLGASGLNFNSGKNAELVTHHGREILKKSILWATGKAYHEDTQLQPDQC